MTAETSIDLYEPEFLGNSAFRVEGAGGKAAVLHELVSAGFTVPAGFVVESGVDVDATSDEQLSEWIAAIGGFPVAVRSSGTMEDLGSTSFAGLYQTFLDVNDLTTLRQRVADCRASLDSQLVSDYAHHHGLDVGTARVSVLVQRLVRPVIAGVGFSIDPVSGIEQHALVECCAGLGERLVSGQTLPTRAVIDLRTGQCVEHTVGDDGVSLDAASCTRLAELLLKIQAERHCPQDVEWAIDADGVLWLLQSRPVTSISWRTDVGELTDADFRDGGVSARVCTPLMFSLYQNAFQHAMQQFWVGLRLLDPAVEPTWITMLYGRPYWNVGAVKDRYANIPGYDEQLFDTDLGINKVYGDRGPRKTPLTPVVLARALPAALQLASGYRRQLGTVRKFAGWWQTEYARWQERLKRINDVDDSAFAAELSECLLSFHAQTERTYFSTIYYNTCAQNDCKKAIEKVDAATKGQTSIVDMMGGLAEISHMRLQRGIVALHRIADETGLTGERWNAAVDQFIDTHGFHADVELDLTHPRWSEDSGRVVTLIRGMLEAGTVPADPDIALDDQRRRFEKELNALRERIGRGRWHRIRFARAAERHVDRMRRYLIAREQMREYSSQCYAVVRSYVVEAGRRLAAGGQLNNEDDVFMLSLWQLADLVNGRVDGPVLAQEIAYQRAMYAGYRDLAPPHELGEGITAPVRPQTGQSSALIGLGCSPGIAEGTAKVVLSLTDIDQVRPGDILVTRFTDPGWTPALGLVSAVVTEVGGLLSHAAVISREYGIPAVLSVPDVTSTLRCGQRIRVDGATGEVTVIDHPDESSR